MVNVLLPVKMDSMVMYLLSPAKVVMKLVKLVQVLIMIIV